MRTAFILIAGSRGDTEPLLALTHSLFTYFSIDHVHLFLQPEYADLPPSDPRTTVHPLPFTSASFASHSVAHFRKASSVVGRVIDTIQIQTLALASILSNLFTPTISSLYSSCIQHQPFVIISTTLYAPIAQTLADALQIPSILINLQPNTPTAYYPYYMSSVPSAVSAAVQLTNLYNGKPAKHSNNLTTYQAQTNLHQASLPALNAFRRTINLRPLTLQSIADIYKGHHPNLHIFNAYSSQLCPRAPDWPENVHLIPSLAAGYIPQNWTAENDCPKLVQYLTSAHKPVLVTFGSMRGSDKTAISRTILQGLRDAGMKRIVLLKGVSDLGAHHLSFRDADLKAWATKHVYPCSEPVQYAWLLPRCSLIICHGGAGTIGAALHAGIPIVVAPVMCDQFMWGRLIADRGLGAVVLPSLSTATSESLCRAVEKALDVETILTAAKLGKSLDDCYVVAKLIAQMVEQRGTS